MTNNYSPKVVIIMPKHKDQSYRFQCVVTITCPTAAIANNLALVLLPENRYVNTNTSHIELIVNGTQLIITFYSNEKISTVRNTIDDILFSISTASNVGDII